MVIVGSFGVFSGLDAAHQIKTRNAKKGEQQGHEQANRHQGFHSTTNQPSVGTPARRNNLPEVRSPDPMHCRVRWRYRVDK